MTETMPLGSRATGDAEDRRSQLHAAIEVCDPAPLLMSLVHVTGDTGLLDEFGPRLALSEPGSHYRTGTRPA
ncbi:MAG: flavin-containing monooxygenase, partial [Rhodococcus sp. (in: high G+C Gram-positive bacteria)]